MFNTYLLLFIFYFPYSNILSNIYKNFVINKLPNNESYMINNCNTKLNTNNLQLNIHLKNKLNNSLFKIH